MAWCVEPSRISISISGVVLATRHPPSAAAFYTYHRQFLAFTGRPLDTSFANNVINYSFARFRDADNRQSPADRRAGQSVHSSADGERKTARGSTTRGFRLPPPRRHRFVQSNPLRYASPQLNFTTIMTCTEINDCLLHAVYVTRS